MSKAQTTSNGFMILSIASVVNKILALIYLPIQTLIVGNYGNGIIGIGYKIYIFIFALTNAGIPVAISKMISEQDATGNYEESKKTLKIATWLLFLVGLFFCLLMIAGSGWLSDQSGQPGAKLMLITLAPTLIFSSIASSFRGYFQGHRNMVPTAISRIIEQALNSALTIVFAALLIKYGAEKAAAGTTIGTSLGALGAALYLVWVYIRSKKDLSFAESLPKPSSTKNSMTSKQILKKLLAYGIPITLGSIALNSSDIIDLMFGITRLRVAGFSLHKATELYGILTNQYQKILNLPLAITVSLPVALTPAISLLSTAKDNLSLNKKINEAFKVIMIISIPCAAGLAVLAKPAITLVFFSLKNNQGSDLMQIGSWAIIIFSISYIQNSVLTGIGKVFISPVSIFVGLIVKAILNYFLVAIPFLNVKGAIIGTLVGYSITCLLNHIMIKRYIDISIDSTSIILKPLLASAIMSVFAYFSFDLSFMVMGHIIKSGLLLNDICVGIAVVISFIVYFIALVILKGITSEDILRFPKGKLILKYVGKYVKTASI